MDKEENRTLEKNGTDSKIKLLPALRAQLNL